jgi:hypothetical protein
VDLAEAHAIQPLDEDAHAFERPQLGAEVVGHGALEQGLAQRIELLGVEPRRAARGHRAQRVNAAFIEPGLPRVRGLPGHAH